MNIGIVVDNELNHDVRVLKEIEILKKGDHVINVICFGFDNIKYPPIEGVQIERIRISRKVKNLLYFFQNRLPVYEWWWGKKISSFIKKYQIDVLHAHDLYMSKASHAGINASKRKCPLILDLHENFPAAIMSYNWTRGAFREFFVKPHAWAAKENEYLEYADHLIVLSDSFKSTLLRNHPNLQANEITILPNVIDFRKFENYQIDPNVKKRDGVTLLYFGAVAERRGIFDSLYVMNELVEQNQPVNLLIIGPVDKADRKRFFAEITQEQLKPFIEYIPWIGLEKLPTYLSISDICLAPFHKNPQHESGVANKIFQYMYGQKPIVGSDCTPQKELIESFDCGLIYRNLAEFKDHLTHLIKNPEIRESMGSNGYSALYKHFDSDAQESDLLNVYHQLQVKSD